MVKQEPPKLLDEGPSPSVPAKTCSTCKESKILNEFSKNKCKPDGYSYICKTCQNINTQRHYKNNKQYYYDRNIRRKEAIREWLATYKNDLKCEKCGEDRWYVLDFHHINPKEKDFNLSKCVAEGISLKTIKKEIEKCNILCSNCHRELHYLEKQT